jgi:hypothetical protein
MTKTQTDTDRQKHYVLILLHSLHENVFFTYPLPRTLDPDGVVVRFPTKFYSHFSVHSPRFTLCLLFFPGAYNYGLLVVCYVPDLSPQ